MAGVCYYDGKYACTIVPPDGNCAASPGCKKIGTCTLIGGECRVTSDADCQQASHRCGENGLCHFDGNGGCKAATPDECAKSPVCATEGACTLNLGGWCVVASKEDCLTHDVCVLGGQCEWLLTGHGYAFCVPADEGACAASQWCRSQGRCGRWSRSESDGIWQCAPTTQAHCTDSTDCKAKGLCRYHAGWHRCVR